MAETGSRRGAWGYRLAGVDGAAGVLVEAPPSWPQMVVTAEEVPGVAAPDELAWSSRQARIPLLGGGWVEVEREPATVRLVLPRRPADECVVQPHLSSAIAASTLWAGHQPFHGGSFVVHGRAWVVLADKEGGKSTTMAWLHHLGLPVLADDLSVWADGEVLIGPRCVDLRPEPAARLGMGRDLGVIGTRSRWRIGLPDAAPSVPLGGFVLLGWAPDPCVERLPAAARLPHLEAHRALRLPWARADLLLELASVPCVRWTRPRDWDRLAAGVDHLLQELSAG